MDLLKIRTLAGIAITPEHFKQTKELREAKKERMEKIKEQEMDFEISKNRNEPNDPSMSTHVSPDDPELQELLALLKTMSDEEILNYVKDLISKSHEALGSTPGPESIVNEPTTTEVPSVEEEPVIREDHLHEGTGVYGDNQPNTLSHTNEKGAVNVAGEGFPFPGVGITISDDGNTEKVHVPQSIKTTLQNTISELRQVAERVEKRDPAQHWFNNMAADAIEEILNYLKQGTVTGIKEAQIQTTKLMGPILQRIPDEVFLFIARGGQNRSLKDYFYEVKISR